jgi:hypothetical protein
MELRKFTTTTIREYLNENLNNQKHKLPEYWFHGKLINILKNSLWIIWVKIGDKVNLVYISHNT